MKAKAAHFALEHIDRNRRQGCTTAAIQSGATIIKGSEAMVVDMERQGVPARNLYSCTRGTTPGPIIFDTDAVELIVQESFKLAAEIDAVKEQLRQADECLAALRNTFSHRLNVSPGMPMKALEIATMLLFEPHNDKHYVDAHLWLVQDACEQVRKEEK